MGGLSILERLEIFAEGGVSKGFSLRLWKKQAEQLKNWGISLGEPSPTEREGAARYAIDFSNPPADTVADRLCQTAKKAKSETKKYSPLFVITPTRIG